MGKPVGIAEEEGKRRKGGEDGGEGVRGDRRVPQGRGGRKREEV